CEGKAKMVSLAEMRKYLEEFGRQSTHFDKSDEIIKQRIKNVSFVFVFFFNNVKYETITLVCTHLLTKVIDNVHSSLRAHHDLVCSALLYVCVFFVCLFVLIIKTNKSKTNIALHNRRAHTYCKQYLKHNLSDCSKLACLDHEKFLEGYSGDNGSLVSFFFLKCTNLLFSTFAHDLKKKKKGS
ncbi:hypothetical protein RFI_27237, partial [Reticulomyxa filosa]